MYAKRNVPVENQWWSGQPVLQVTVSGKIDNRDQALALTKSMVDDIEASSYAHVIVILDLTALGGSPSAAVLLGGSLPQTYKIEQLVMVKAPFLFRMAGAGFPQLRGKLHFVDQVSDARTKATELLSKLPKA
jgi:hypothetical protein